MPFLCTLLCRSSGCSGLDSVLTALKVSANARFSTYFSDGNMILGTFLVPSDKTSETALVNILKKLVESYKKQQEICEEEEATDSNANGSCSGMDAEIEGSSEADREEPAVSQAEAVTAETNPDVISERYNPQVKVEPPKSSNHRTLDLPDHGKFRTIDGSQKHSIYLPYIIQV
ncbi:hypothetical protein E2C01_038889 [Portunus trituberculatus]|uniref:Uncharacterized protein n=1 Tax=Portunus trituberculatus TaxID=210409 RepID=A0A5B7FI40_PORTR|nr:hypothetical protein [Portunus trituberculatus]